MPFHVLVVEDFPDGAESMALFLREHGLTADAARTGAEAVESAEARAPDALVTDIVLPDTDGYELARRLCELLPRRPLLVALTGYDSEDRSQREGFDHHFVKPVDPELLLRVLRPPGASLPADG